MSHLAKKVIFTSISPTITQAQTQDTLFQTLLLQKLKNKILQLSDLPEVVVFGKKCQFKLEEIQLKQGLYKGEKVVITDDTTLEVHIEGEY